MAVERRLSLRSKLSSPGLAPSDVIRNARPGAVYLVNDEAISLPESAITGEDRRTMHEHRRVILVQSLALTKAASPPTLLVVPCSSSARSVRACDLELPPGEPGFSADRVVAYASLVQPILKRHLKTCCGQLRDETLLQLQALLASNLALLISGELRAEVRRCR